MRGTEGLGLVFSHFAGSASPYFKAEQDENHEGPRTTGCPPQNSGIGRKARHSK